MRCKAQPRCFLKKYKQAERVSDTAGWLSLVIRALFFLSVVYIRSESPAPISDHLILFEGVYLPVTRHASSLSLYKHISIGLLHGECHNDLRLNSALWGKTGHSKSFGTVALNYFNFRARGIKSYIRHDYLLTRLLVPGRLKGRSTIHDYGTRLISRYAGRIIIIRSIRISVLP